MHDLLTAQDIVKTALHYAKRNKLRSISKMVVELGTITVHGERITPDDLKFNIGLVARNTILEKAKVIIKQTKKGENWKIKFIEGTK